MVCKRKKLTVSGVKEKKLMGEVIGEFIEVVS